MGELIPLEYYESIYYYFLLAICLVIYGASFSTPLENEDNLKRKDTLGIAMLVLSVLYIGLRPISGAVFGDMRTYAESFLRYAGGDVVDTSPNAKDVYFEYFIKACSSVMSVEMFFLLCAAIYIVPLYFTCKRLFGKFWFYAFAMLLFSFSFWSYGTNGIRNGMATSIFLLAISFDRKILTYLTLAFCILVHKSMLIPIGAYLLATNYRNTKAYLTAWFVAIPLSFVLGKAIEAYFLGIGMFDDSRISEYFGEGEELPETIYKAGFRWDFLLYGGIGMFVGWYFIVKKKYDDPFYKLLFHTYAIANAFWILVIRVNYSNRFAYLSWFMLGLVIIYPYLKNRFFDRQHEVVAKVELAYFAFTFFMAIVINS